jgi:hypothetical protein
MKSLKTALILIFLLACNLALSAAIPASERQALIDLYNSTNGDAWHRNWKSLPLHSDGFSMPGTENTWYGVTTDSGNTTVIQLNLDNCSLVGIIPASLGNLSNLKYLNLSYNDLSGSIPSQLSNLNNLQELWLQGTHLSGSIPTSFGNLSNLQLLVLETNQLSGSIPASLGNLSKLQRLELYFSQLSGSIPAELGKLSNLEELNLSQTQLSGSIPAELGNLSKLRALSLNSTQLTGSIPASLGNLSNLQHLILSSNQLSGSIPAELGNLSKLQRLELYSNQLSGNIPTSLANLTILDTVGIRYNALHTSDVGLISFLNYRDRDWALTQTIAPTNVTAVPNGSTSITVSWTPITYTGDTGGYRVFVATASGGPYTFFAQTANKSASSQLVTGLTPSSTYYFVVQTRTNASGGNQNVVDSENSAEVSATTTGNLATITVTSPNGGEIWAVGSSHNITWTSTGTIANVKIEYSTNGGTGWTTVIASTTNNGTYSWTVPNTPSTQCLVRVSEASAGTPADMSNAVFSIVSSSITISGTVTSNGVGLSNVVMNGLPGNPATNSSGQYTGTVSSGWSGTVTPTLAGYSFDPLSKSYTNVSANEIQNYTATLNTLTISGTVKVGETALENVVMAGLPGTVKTDAGGNYSGSVPYGWSGTVTPTLAGYTFDPASRSYTNVKTNQVDQNYIAAVVINTHTISGTVTSEGVGLSNVVMNGLPGNPATNSSGQYTGTVNSGWSGTVTPTLAGYTFNPASRSYTDITSAQPNQNYSATAIVYTVKFVASPGGTISGNPVQSINYGRDTAPVTAVPNAGYQFVIWTGDYTGTENPLVIHNVHNNMTVQAGFENIPPSVRIVSPRQGELVSGLVDISADVSDDTTVTKVEVFVDGIKMGDMSTSMTTSLVPTKSQSELKPTDSDISLPKMETLGWTVDLTGGIAAYIRSDGKLRKLRANGASEPVLRPDVAVDYFQADSQGGFIAFQQPQKADDGRSYRLMRVDMAGRQMVGIDDDYARFSHEAMVSREIQTDDNGYVYYFVQTEHGDTILRRWKKGGSPYALWDDRMNVNEWKTTPDGKVVVAGETPETGERWVKCWTETTGVTLSIEGDYSYDKDALTLNFFAPDRIVQYYPALESIVIRGMNKPQRIGVFGNKLLVSGTNEIVVVDLTENRKLAGFSISALIAEACLLADGSVLFSGYEATNGTYVLGLADGLSLSQGYGTYRPLAALDGEPHGFEPLPMFENSQPSIRPIKEALSKNGAKTKLVTSSQSNYHYEWDTMMYSAGEHRIRIVATADSGLTASDEITVNVRNLELQLFGRRMSAWIFKSPYAMLTLVVGNPGNVSIGRLLIYRKETGGEFAPLVELQGSGGTRAVNYLDKNLDTKKTYVYVAVAYGPDGEIILLSNEITI